MESFRIKITKFIALIMLLLLVLGITISGITLLHVNAFGFIGVICAILSLDRKLSLGDGYQQDDGYEHSEPLGESTSEKMEAVRKKIKSAQDKLNDKK